MNKANLIYELFIDARGCYYEILVNDVPVYFHYNVGATAFRLPINSFIVNSGEQKISLKMISIVAGKSFPQGTEISLVIDTYPNGEPRERENVITYKTKTFKEKNLGIFAEEIVFSASVPYELTDWKHGADLSNEDKNILRRELEKKYVEYTDTFKKADLSNYKELTKLRQGDIFKAMYYTIEQKSLAENSYFNGIHHDKIKFHPLENYRLVFYGNGRLIGLQKNLEAPGIFIDNEDESEAFMEYILFYKRSKSSPLEIVF